MDHELVAHPAHPSTAIEAISASVVRRGDKLVVAFSLQGDMTNVEWNDDAPALREDELWKHTVFEVFVRHAGVEGYREYNVAVSGAWAAYDLVSREDKTNAKLGWLPKVSVRRGTDEAQVELTVPIKAGLASLGICAVIEDTDGALSYWALSHEGDRPDFHAVSAHTAAV